MPKKYQQKSLQIKPQSSSPHTLSLSKANAASHHGLPQRNVNDLLRESRRQQLRNEQQKSTPVALNPTAGGSIPPSVRAVLDLPPPPPPQPRVGRSRTVAGSEGGVAGQQGGLPIPFRGLHPRERRPPGPPPPRSWLAASIHAPAKYRQGSGSCVESENDGYCIQVRSSTLPGGSFPPPTSLQHLVLKSIAINWAFHADYDHDYIGGLPTNLKETLLSYIAVYNHSLDQTVNPLRILFFDEEELGQDDRDEVQRLDLGNGVGAWTGLKGLEKDLFSKTAWNKAVEPSKAEDKNSETPDSWDAEDNSDDNGGPSLGTVPKVIHNFRNLRHLSLAISPQSPRTASWSSLLSLATELGTLTSLSLAHWPQPTFTPNAATTRAVIRVPGARPVVYGGTDMYTALDNNWREAAGILRTLSRALYCLTWLDLTGCSSWWEALVWRPHVAEEAEEGTGENVGPEWNGGWRGLEKLILQYGWELGPEPRFEPEPAHAITGSGEPSWNVEHERIKRDWRAASIKLKKSHLRALKVCRRLRTLRKESSGKWLEVDIGRNGEAGVIRVSPVVDSDSELIVGL